MYTQILPRLIRAATLGLSGLVILLPSVYAQTAQNNVYSLKEAYDAAEQNSPTLQKSQSKAEEMKWKNFEGLSGFLPTLQVQVDRFIDERYELLDVPFDGANVEIPQIFPTSSLTLQANWMLFDGFGNVNNYDSTKALKSAAESEYDWARFQLHEDVKLQYAKVIANKKLQDVAQENLKTLQNHLDQVQKMKSGGVSTNYDVLSVEARLSEAQTELLETQDNAAIAQQQFAQTLGLNDAIDAKETDLEVPNAGAVKALVYKNDFAKRKDIDALQNRVVSADKKDSVSGAFLIPKISLGAQYIFYNNLDDSMGDFNSYRKAYNVGFFLTWDIFAPAAYAKSRQEKEQTVQAQKTLNEATLKAPVDFIFWKKRYLYSAALYDSKKVDLDRATETVRLANAGFKAGVRTTTEVLDAELDLFRARAGIVTAQLNCEEAKTKLELAMGENL
jgi:outer membrane protein TolC